MAGLATCVAAIDTLSKASLKRVAAVLLWRVAAIAGDGVVLL